MVEELFSKQRQLINGFFDQIDHGKTKKILDQLVQCKGTVIFSGVGKSGIIANKLTMTLISTGTRAFYLPPMDALHGDIGVLGPDDLFVCLSKSGETDELLKMIPYVRKKGCKIISIVSNPHSRLAKKADEYIFLPIDEELCPFNLSPTTSTAVQLIFGDVLAVALMRAKGFTLDEYAKNHPAGAIGKRIALFVEDLMLKKDQMPLCHSNDRVMEILHLISSKRCGALLIVDHEKHLEGIFTDGDLRRAIQKAGEDFLNLPVGQVMTKRPRFTHPRMLAYKAMQMMEEDPKRLITVLPVVDEHQKVVGILRMHDILQAGLTS